MPALWPPSSAAIAMCAVWVALSHIKSMSAAADPSKLTKVRVAGVPEHFNSPWHIGKERGLFSEKGVDLEFIEYSGGTGAMTAALRSGEVDMAVALTEGLIADIALKGSEDYIIASPYVSVPLRWGLWAAPDSDIQSDEDLKGKVFGISRFGSGSHIMSTVLAKNKGWDSSDVSFGEPAGGLPGLMAGINDGSIDVFMWNYSTTKPLADKGELKHVGDLYTPWPCFMIAVSQSLIREKREVVRSVLSTIKKAAAAFLAEGDASVDYVVEKHGIKKEDASDWFSGLGYADTDTVTDSVLSDTISALRETKIISTEPAREELVISVVEVEGGHTFNEIEWEYHPTKDELFHGLICPASSPLGADGGWAAYEPMAGEYDPNSLMNFM